MEQTNKEETEKANINSIAATLGLLGGALIIAGTIGYNIGRGLQNRIPDNDKVQSGYVAPSDVKIIMRDEDKNGELETIVEVEGKSYAFRKVNDRPVLVPYTVNSPQIEYEGANK